MRLIERFYHHMATRPEVAHTWAMHHPDLTKTKARLLAFLTLWLGGSNHYRARYGEPFMRRRHFAFSIGPRKRDEDSLSKQFWVVLERVVTEETEVDFDPK